MARVFISYSHDSAEHGERVLRFADALRRHGVDAELDRSGARSSFPLHRARLFFREDRDHAREELKKARALIERCGYHRRDEEVRDAEEAIG